MSMAQLMQWYQKLDKETLDLVKRFFAKGVASGDLNAYLKKVLSKEVDGVITIDSPASQRKEA
jgi:tryptophan synthase alpha subunit